MPQHTASTRKTPKQIDGAIRGMVRSLVDGTGRFGGRMRRIVFGNYAQYMFRKIDQAYQAKASGGSDELGLKWAPLPEATIVARRIRHIDAVTHGLSRTRKRGILTPAQDKLWRRIFRSRVMELVAAGYDEKTQAKPRAAAQAWAILKRMGVKTRKDTMKFRKFKILIDSKRLNSSLKPGHISGGEYKKRNADQLYHVSGGTMRMGTLVPYAKRHKTGTARMPARPPIPPSKMMHQWSVDGANHGLNEATKVLVNRL